MKRAIIIFIPSLLLLFLLSCNSATQKQDEHVLTVTIEPQRYFLERIVGEQYKVNTLVPPGSSPETYEPAPAVMVDLGKSEAYFKVGFLGFENAWSENLKQNNPNVKIVDCSAGIDLIHETQDHAEEQGHNHGGADPHVWSSSKTAKVFVKNMFDNVITIDPGVKDQYQQNFDSLNLLIDRTDSTVTAILKDIPSRSFIIYHPALAYFARDYGLKQYTIEFEGKKPSPVQIKNIIDLAKTENIDIVFVQLGFDSKNAEVIAKEIGAKVYTINPLAYEWDKEMIRIASILAGKTNE
ncbi:MAG: zinc ABC transporter substrate-binding protein [Dysgonamonadaceae bacterium]